MELCHFCAAIAAFRLRNGPFLDQTCFFIVFSVCTSSGIGAGSSTELNIVVVEGEGQSITSPSGRPARPSSGVEDEKP